MLRPHEVPGAGIWVYDSKLRRDVFEHLNVLHHRRNVDMAKDRRALKWRKAKAS